MTGGVVPPRGESAAVRRAPLRRITNEDRARRAGGSTKGRGPKRGGRKGKGKRPKAKAVQSSADRVDAVLDALDLLGVDMRSESAKARKRERSAGLRTAQAVGAKRGKARKAASGGTRTRARASARQRRKNMAAKRRPTPEPRLVPKSRKATARAKKGRAKGRRPARGGGGGGKRKKSRTTNKPVTAPEAVTDARAQLAAVTKTSSAATKRRTRAQSLKAPGAHAGPTSRLAATAGPPRRRVKRRVRSRRSNKGPKAAVPANASPVEVDSSDPAPMEATGGLPPRTPGRQRLAGSTRVNVSAVGGARVRVTVPGRVAAAPNAEPPPTPDAAVPPSPMLATRAPRGLPQLPEGSSVEVRNGRASLPLGAASADTGLAPVSFPADALDLEISSSSSSGDGGPATLSTIYGTAP